MTIKHEFVVDIVKDKVNSLCLTVICYRRDEILGENDPRRVVGTVEDDRFGIGSYRFFDILHARVEGAILRGHDDWDPIDHFDHLRVAHPVWCKNNDLILRIQYREEDIEKRLLCTS
jgi:hypothetical protein